jgi:hypothetical protein
MASASRKLAHSQLAGTHRDQDVNSTVHCRLVRKGIQKEIVVARKIQLPAVLLRQM